MIIENIFQVRIAPDRALDVLTDVPAIAPCIPGVTLTSAEGDTYQGNAAVRLGPVALTFAGTARIVEIDREARTARVEAEGADQKGRGRAQAKVDFVLTPEGDGTQVAVRSDVTLSGQVAQYGRASGLVKEVANQIIGQFVANLEEKLAGETAAGGDTSDAATASAPGEAPAARKQEISGLTLLWRALVAMIAGLFRRSGAK